MAIKARTIRIRVIVPKIRNESEFSDWCDAATLAALSGDSSAAEITQPIYMRDDRDYTIGGSGVPLPYFRLSCSGNGRLEWPGVLADQVVLGRIVLYATRARFDAVEFTKFENNGTCIKPLNSGMQELVLKNCWYHDCSNLVGSNETHYSSLCQFDINNVGGGMRFECDGLLSENNGLNNQQFRHDLYCDADETVVTNCTFINSGNLSLNKDPDYSGATCEVAYCTWTQDNPGVTQWWNWALNGGLGGWSFYDDAAMGHKRNHLNMHDCAVTGWFDQLYQGYWDTPETDGISFSNNVYDVTLVDSAKLVRQLGEQTWYSAAQWQALGLDTDSSITINGVPV